MWCIGQIGAEYRQRMYELLALYGRRFDPRQPVVCVDEKSLQLADHSRPPLPMGPGAPAKDDYEYVRRGTSNLFVAVEPQAGRRTVAVTARRCKTDFVAFIGSLLSGAYATARRVHIVLDNLNIHLRKSFDDVLGREAAQALLARVRFHYTPKHASWLNMAEIEIGTLTRQGLNRRLPNRQTLVHEVECWQRDRNAMRATIAWTFTRQDADRKLGRHYVPLITG
jgi:hypothetical protein